MIVSGLLILSLPPFASPAAGDSAADSTDNTAADYVADTLTVHSPDGSVYANFIMLEGFPRYGITYHFGIYFITMEVFL